MPNLRFVHVSSAGTDLWHKHPKFLDKDVVFCTTSGSNSYVRKWVPLSRFYAIRVIWN